ncbi:MAG: type II toxin-antitoxin system RelE/ParE family toxin [Chloroflexota bacterium]
MKIEFHVLASDEIVEAAYWYETQLEGLSDTFLAEMQNAVDAIAQNPDAWGRVNRNIRRKAFHKFPYELIYEVNDSKILILAVAHQKMRPNYWADRL